MDYEIWKDGELISTEFQVDSTQLPVFAPDTPGYPGNPIVIETDQVSLEPTVLTPEEIATRMREAFDSVAIGSLTVTKLKLAMEAAINAIGTTS